MSRHANQSMKMIAAGDLRIDPAAQRDLRPQWARYLADNLDESMLGILEVSERSPGVYYVTNGQHRVFACRLRGEGNRLLACHVQQGLSIEAEARQFIGLNTVKTIGAFDKFHVRLNFDPDAQAIEKAVHAVGLKLGVNGDNGFVTAVDALEQVYRGTITRSKEITPWALSRTLRTLHGAWFDNRDAFTSQMIRGAGGVHLRYSDAIEQAHLERALAKFNGGPVQVLSRAKIRREVTTGTLWRAVAEVMVDTYNKGRRSTKLPDWSAA